MAAVGERIANLRGQPTSHERILRLVAAASLACALTGCGTITEQTAQNYFTKPGKYSVYTCKDIDDTTRTVRARQVELEQLMARASQGPGGEFVNAIAYRTEYLQARGDLLELGEARAEKQCAAESQFSSGRAVF